MRWCCVDPLPEDPPGLSERLSQIRAFWEQLDVMAGGTPGETTWGELERLRAEADAALARTPMDISKAESLVAYAALLMAGLATN